MIHVGTQAQQFELEMNKIPGASSLLPRRQYGTADNTDQIAQNLTLSSLINRLRPDISAYLGIQSSADVREAEERDVHQLRKQSMTMQTEKLLTANERAAKVREQQLISGINPMTGRYF